MVDIHFETFTLDNGLKVLIHEDHSIPKVVVDILYKVGAKDELIERTGFAHLFEHLMFEGSKHIEHFDRALQRVGGQSNAFTNADITNYYIHAPSNQLETALWLESDRLLALDFSQEKLDIQKSVVIEEYKQRYLNQPYGDALLKLRALHFESHPYQWPTIGKEISHIEEATLQEVKDFFYGYYAPNNATLVVAGDVDPKEVKTLVEKWFGGIPARALKKHPLPQERPQREARSMTLSGEVPHEAIYKMYHMPAHTQRGYYVCDLLTDILSFGKSSRLFQAMVKTKQVSPSVNAYSLGLHDPGAMVISGNIAEGKTREQYETALQECIDDLQALTEEELQRTKNKLMATFVMQNVTIQNKAMALALGDAIGNPNIVNETPALYQSITLDEIKAAAKQYFATTNCSTLYYLPKQA